MTPKQILDSFSQTLLQDERILSPQERALLIAIVQQANAASVSTPEIQQAVRAVISSSVGEIVAQRAFAVLGGSIVDGILQSTSAVAVRENMRASTEHLGPKDPQPPRPSPVYSPLAPSPPAPSPAPQPPQIAARTAVCESTVAVAERPQQLPARCIVLDEFLAPQELAELTRFTLEHEADFQASEIVSPHSEGGVVNYEHRSSRVLMDAGKHQDIVLNRIKATLPEIVNKLGMQEFPIADVEAQITASNDGDFFHFHSDNASERVASRYLTFVYFFHNEPRSFEGGELRIHDARLENGEYVSQGTYQTIVPGQNQIVFFPCELLHEITPVTCKSRRFADSRFTLNGWLRR